MTQLVNYAQLSERQAQDLVREVQPLQTLEEVTRWGLQQAPPRMILDLVVQDVYCHDLVMEWRDGLFLAFDTT